MPQADEETGPPAAAPDTIDPPDERTPDEVEKKAADDDHDGPD
ncbi:MAG: hypothetical protein QOJ52_2299 [Acidimicrobiaceae bacterium]|nr:hypothetical protein [Acidimicrobiaceae bacterium]MDQ1440708.1 hypothetical protein [Acidimicrobiaceae bacterium]